MSCLAAQHGNQSRDTGCTSSLVQQNESAGLWQNQILRNSSVNSKVILTQRLEIEKLCETTASTYCHTDYLTVKPKTQSVTTLASLF